MVIFIFILFCIYEMRHKWRHKSNPWSKVEGHPRSKFEGHSEWKREACECWEPRRCDMKKLHNGEYCKTTGTYAIDPQPNLRALSLPPGHPNLARRQRRNTQHRRPPPPAPPARRISSLSPSSRSSVPFLLHHGLSLIIVARCRSGANTRRCWFDHDDWCARPWWSRQIKWGKCSTKNYETNLIRKEKVNDGGKSRCATRDTKILSRGRLGWW